MAEAIFASRAPLPSGPLPRPFTLAHPLTPPRPLLGKRPSPVGGTVRTAAPARTVSRSSDHGLVHVCSVVVFFYFIFDSERSVLVLRRFFLLFSKKFFWL